QGRFGERSMALQPRFARPTAWLIAAALLAPGFLFAGSKPKEWNPSIGASDFVAVVDNDFFPLPAGRHWFHHGMTQDGGEGLEIEVMSTTKHIMNINTTVVIERDQINGQIVEISENWFAQDNDGAVWYFGEATQTYVNGQPGSTAGSWEAGQNGARPGIIMESD